MPIALPGSQAHWPKAYLSLRAAGSMSLNSEAGRQARASWLRALGFDAERALTLTLVHSRDVVAAESPGELDGIEADGIVSANPELCALVTVADCMPIFLFDPESGAYGMLHSGWKGTGILVKAARLMAERYGTKMEKLSVHFGPHIGSCCYRVDEERAALFAGEFGSAALSRVDGQPHLNLLAANLGLARSLGIGALSYSSTCTVCDDSLGSYRREGALGFTRMAAVIGYPRLEGAP
jgi:YfiH family protein